MKHLDERYNKKINKNITFEKYSIELNKFNIEDFAEALKVSSKLEKTYYEGKDLYPHWHELHQDLWDILYKYNPTLVEEDKMDIRYLLNREMIKTIMDSNMYKEVRELTRLDFLGSIISSEVMSEELKKLVEELNEEQKAILDEMSKIMDQMSDDENQDGTDVIEGEDQGTGSIKKPDDKKWSLEEAQKRLEEEKDKLKKLVDKKVVGKINRFTNAAKVKLEEVQNFISAWGLEESEYYMKSGYQEKMQLLDQLRSNSKLKEIANLAGKYKRFAKSLQKQQIKYGTDSIHNVVLGDDLGKILPSELMKLSNNTLKNLFKIDFLEKKMLQYEYLGKEKVGKGAIIACIDSSGSMEGIAEVWAKAVALGLLEIARIGKRDFYVIHFDSSDKSRLHTNYFPKDKNLDLNEMIDMAEFFSSGGTLFEPPLELAQDLIMKEKQFSKADIIFITDGESAVTQSWLKNYLAWKKQNNVKIYSVLINTYQSTTLSLDLFSDRTYLLSDLDNQSRLDDNAFELFNLI